MYSVLPLIRAPWEPSSSFLNLVVRDYCLRAVGELGANQWSSACGFGAMLFRCMIDCFGLVSRAFVVKEWSYIFISTNEYY